MTGSTPRTPRLSPSVWQWLGYAYGRGLPRAQRDWVREDLTGAHWVRRHFERTLAQCAPSLLLLLLPGPWLLRASLPLLVVLGAMYVSVSYLQETRAHRLIKHGFDPQLGHTADAERQQARDVVREAEMTARRAVRRPGRDRSFRRW